MSDSPTDGPDKWQCSMTWWSVNPRWKGEVRSESWLYNSRPVNSREDEMSGLYVGGRFCAGPHSDSFEEEVINAKERQQQSPYTKKGQKSG